MMKQSQIWDQCFLNFINFSSLLKPITHNPGLCDEIQRCSINDPLLLVHDCLRCTCTSISCLSGSINWCTAVVVVVVVVYSECDCHLLLSKMGLVTMGLSTRVTCPNSFWRKTWIHSRTTFRSYSSVCSSCSWGTVDTHTPRTHTHTHSDWWVVVIHLHVLSNYYIQHRYYK